jgi:thymidylate synthase
MYKYLELMQTILDEGEQRGDRTGTGTLSLFGESLKFDLREGFPLLTTKKMYWKGIVHELIWFLNGGTNIKYLTDNNVHIWDEWAEPDGSVGPVYGKQWRQWNGFEDLDQIEQLLKDLVGNPTSRRHIVSAWNVEDLPLMGLPPCHLLFQCYVSQGQYLDLQMYQRSADYFLGVPFNIASYAALMHLIGQVTDLQPRKLKICFGDVHIYNNHIEQCKKQLSRLPMDLPRLEVDPADNFLRNLDFKDFCLTNYTYHPAIEAPISK